MTTNLVTLAWNDNSHNESGFIIERCQSSGKCKNFVPIGQTGTGVVTFLNDGLSPGTTYFYRVRAFNAVGNSAFSNTITIKTLRR